MVEIVKVIKANARVLILDEPTRIFDGQGSNHGNNFQIMENISFLDKIGL